VRADNRKLTQRALYDNGWLNGMMLRARLLHLLLCQRTGARQSEI